MVHPQCGVITYCQLHPRLWLKEIGHRMLKGFDPSKESDSIMVRLKESTLQEASGDMRTFLFDKAESEAYNKN